MKETKKENEQAFAIHNVSNCADENDEPWYDSEDCEYCLEEFEQEGMEYTHDFTWENGTWVCDHCGRPQ